MTRIRQKPDTVQRIYTDKKKKTKSTLCPWLRQLLDISAHGKKRQISTFNNTAMQ